MIVAPAEVVLPDFTVLGNVVVLSSIISVDVITIFSVSIQVTSYLR